ncbi:MAG TPA: PAS domain S-box protein [Thermoanaerobaculaceae bacterium]|nr:PAS domain S-box protein [Thermoanaerobaculaceae bacterium]
MLLVLALAGLCVGLIAAPRYRARSIERWRGQLSVMADDRSSAVEQWVADRLDDARSVAGFPSVASLLEESGSGRVSATFDDRRTRLDAIVRLVSSPANSVSTMVLATDGRLVAEVGDGRRPDPARLELARQCLRAGRPLTAILLDDGGRPVAEFVAPVVGSASARPIGVVLIAVDPERWLYPFLRHQPLPTETGEALLVAQQGDAAVFLTPLRHSPARPPTLRLPLATAGLAAAAAVGGRETFGEFVDYRGARVFATTRRITGTSWALVVKVDRNEALAEYRRWLVRTFADLALALLGAGGLGYGVWYRNRLRLREAATANERRLAELVNEANNAVFVTSADGTVLQANRRAEELYGYSAEELRGLTVADMRAPEARDGAEATLQQVTDRDGVTVETVHRRRDGSTFPVEVSVRQAEVRGERFLLGIVRDITLQRAAEARIRRLNRLLRTISEINQLIVRERDRDHLVHEACRILVEHGEFRMAWIGFADEASGTVVPAASVGFADGYLDSITIRFDDTPLGHGPTGTAIREGRTVVVNDWETDKRVAPWREAATRRHYSSSAACPLSVGGKVIGALSVYMDETAAFDAEETVLLGELAGDVAFALAALAVEAERAVAVMALRDSEARYRTLFDSTDDAILVLKDGQFVDCNVRTLEVFECSREQIIDHSPSEFSPDVQRDGSLSAPSAQARIQAALAGEAQSFDWLHCHQDRSPFDAEVSLKAIELNGKMFLQAIVRDITERKRAEEAVRESEERYRTILQTIPEGYYEVDIRGALTFCNDSLTALLGYPRAELIGLSNRAVMDEATAARVYETFNRVYRTGEPARALDWELIRKDGTRIVVETSVSLLRDEENRPVGFRGLLRDVSERTKVEEQLRQAQKMEAIGSLAGGVAHDFNNLLQVLLSQAELLRIHADDPEQVKALGLELGQQISHGASLTRQLLLFSRRETARPEPLDLNDAVTSATRILRRLVRANIVLEVELAPEALPIEADHGQLEQVLMNLAVNAADAMPEGGTLTIRSGALDGERVSVTIEDTGTGIPEVIRERIFEPFFTTKGAGKGTGLGLSVAHGIVTRHGGTIDVESKVGRGTTFRVILPRGGSGDIAGARRPPGEAAEFPEGHGEWILVVEDEDAAREALRDILRTLGYEVIAAASGEEAGALPAEQPFDVLLTDLMLPGISGPQLAVGLQARWPSLRVILMSGYTEDEAVRRGINEGNVRFLQKPFGMAALAHEIRAALTPDPVGEKPG